jgi:hypothetical protein
MTPQVSPSPGAPAERFLPLHSPPLMVLRLPRLRLLAAGDRTAWLRRQSRASWSLVEDSLQEGKEQGIFPGNGLIS